MSETWKDPIVEEVREIRRQIMQEHGNDLDELSKEISEIEKRHADRLSYGKPVPFKKPKTA